MTDFDEDAILRLAQLSADAHAMGDAALAGDFDEVRFRARTIADCATRSNLLSIAEAAREIESVIGPPGAAPGAGYGHAMMRLADLLSPPTFL